MLTAVTIFALPAAATFGFAPAAASSSNSPELQGFTFTPRLTPIDFTVTPESTAIVTVDPGPTATPDGQSEEEEDVELELGGGDWEVGYDFVETEDGGQWHIWHNGEVLIVEPTNLELIALLGAFREQAVIQAQAKADLKSADAAIEAGVAGTILGGIATLGSGVITVFSCAATPITFWAGGGTGWICAGGVLTTTATGALTGASITTGLQGISDRSDAATHLSDSSREAEELFSSIKDHINNGP